MNLDLAEFLSTLLITCFQAFLSSILSLTIGALVAIGLAHKYNNPITQFIVTLPSLLPTLFPILAAFYWFRPFPSGILGVLILHVFINSGIAAMVLARAIHQKGADLAEMAQVLGLNKFTFWRTLFTKTLKQDVYSTFRFVFSSCFASFSVPLIAGGATGTTLEILIFEKVKITGDWLGAIGISLFQILFLGILFRPQSAHHTSSKKVTIPAHYARPEFLWILLGINLVFVGTFASSWFNSWWTRLSPETITNAIFGSIEIWAYTVLLTYLICFIFAFFLVQKKAPILLRLTAPSAMITSFIVYIIFPHTSSISVFKTSLVLASLNFISLLHWIFWPAIREGLQDWEMGRTLGASPYLLIDKVFFRRWIPIFTNVAIVSGIWALGDFAISEVLLENQTTVGLLIREQLGYRIENALGLSSILIFLALCSHLFLKGISHVFATRAQIQSR